MKFSLILLTNLVAIASVRSRSPNPDSLRENLMRQLPQHCGTLANRVKNFKNCGEPPSYPPEFTVEGLPYVCLLASNLVVDVCGENDHDLEERFELLYKMHSNETVCPLASSVCPLAYSAKTSNSKIKDAVNYYNENCKELCCFDKHTQDDCVVLTVLNNLEINPYDKGEEIQPQREQPPMTLQIISKLIDTNPKLKNKNDHVEAVQQIKAEHPVVKHEETATKIESKTTVKTETASDCVTKEKDSKPSDGKVDVKLKANTSGNIKGIHTSNVNAYDNVNQNNKNYDVHYNNNNTNNNIKEVAEEKVRQHSQSPGKIDETETETSSWKSISDASLSSDKKEFAYGATIKGSSDEIVDEDNNEESPENAQLQDAQPDREFETGRLSNPKELYNGDGLFQAEDSHFSAYFLMTISIIIIGYIIYHNKNKIVAYALEGRRGRNGRRRPTSASYRKLDCNLEEAIASNPSHASVTNVVY